MTGFRLLGPVELWVSGRCVDLGPAKRRTLLAALLVDAGRWVAAEALIDRVWGEDPPTQVRATLYAHIARIRRVVADAAPQLYADGSAVAAETSPASPLLRGSGGYRLDIPPDLVDAHRFRSLVTRARPAGGSDPRRVALLREALELWRGDPLAGLPGEWAARTREGWRRQYVDAVVAWADAELLLGGHPGAVADTLSVLVAEHPLSEPPAVSLMRALHAAGRAPEALVCYAALRRRLTDELGTLPGTEAQRVHQAILTGRPTTPVTPPPVPRTPSQAPPAPAAASTPPATTPPALPVPPVGSAPSAAAVAPGLPAAPVAPAPLVGSDPPVAAAAASIPTPPVGSDPPVASGSPVAAPPPATAAPVVLPSSPVLPPRPVSPTPPTTPASPAIPALPTTPAPSTSPASPTSPVPPAGLAPVGRGGGGVGRGRLAPAQLPMEARGFTGREAELAWLEGVLGAAAQPAAATVVVSAVSGTAGVGKSALAVHWAHRARDRFPDGQLYLNLRGYDPDQPVAAADALVRFLAALGVPAQDIPADTDDRAARFRSEVADRRMLIVLDNAATVEQVRPLLPGTGSCAVLVTSRDSLAGLVAREGAHRLELDLLPPAAARTLLGGLIGPRAGADPAAVDALAAQCARLPLALRVAAELAAVRPGTPLAELVVELADEQRRLDLLDADGDPQAAVVAVFSWSMRHLPPDAARTFRLLGLHPGPDLDAHATAALDGGGLADARRTLGVLARAHLVHPVDGGRYGMHDLPRAYAARLAAAEDAPDVRREALDRLFDHYLGTAAAAMDCLHPAEAHQRPDIPPPGTPAPDLSSPDAARAWLNCELPCLTAVAAHTATHGRPTHAIRLSHTLYRHLIGGHHTDGLTIHGHARDAARRIADPASEARALLGLGTAYWQMARHETAGHHHQRALTLFRGVGDPIGQARALVNLGLVAERLGRYGPAGEHFEQALVLYRGAGDQLGEAIALKDLGTVERRLGRYGAAAGHLQEALTLLRRAGNRYLEAHALNDLGIVETRLGRYGPAAGHQEQALTLFRHIGDRYGEAGALHSLGTIHTRLGRPEQAVEHHRQAMALYCLNGDRDGEARALNGLGEAVHAAGKHTDALTHRADALAIAEDIGNPGQQARAHRGLGDAHHALGDLAPAVRCYERALDLYTELGMPEADTVRAALAALTGGTTPLPVPRASGRGGRSGTGPG